MQVAGIREPLDPVIVEKLSELSQEGLHSVSEARRYLELFVQCDLFKGCTPPDKTSRRFYPTNKDIYNHLHKGKPNHFSSLDQKNLEELVQNWKKEHPEDSFLYRPHATKPASDDSSHYDDDSTTPDEEESTQTLLFCHQTSDQRHLLTRYGNQMCLLDATYRTTKYDLPLYFLCVRTNVCFQVVGSFVIQYENTQCITEALMVFKEWNKETWSRTRFMVDFAEEEIQALEIVFQGTYTYRQNKTGVYCIHIHTGMYTLYIQYTIKYTMCTYTGVL